MISRSVILAAAAVAAAGASLVAALARPDDSPAVALDGARLFVDKGCATCHTGPETSPMVGVGPSLAAASAWAADRVEGMSAEEYLAQSMTQPAAFISPAWAGPNGPSIGMPLLRLSDDEVTALVAYLLRD